MPVLGTTIVEATLAGIGLRCGAEGGPTGPGTAGWATNLSEKVFFDAITYFGLMERLPDDIFFL